MDLNTMTWERWKTLPPAQQDAARDLSGLHRALRGLEGYRVAVERHPMTGEPGRFIVGRSTGWRPASLAIARRDSSGGFAVSASDDLGRVTVIEHVR